MFSVYCSQVQAEVLLGPSSIETLVSEAGGVAIAYRCSCGERGLWRPGTAGPSAGGLPLDAGARSGHGFPRPVAVALEEETRAG